MVKIRFGEKNMRAGVLVVLLGMTLACTGSLTGGNQVVEREADEAVRNDGNSGVALTQMEQDFIRILRADRRQRRVRLTFNPVLQRVARARAKDMAQRNYFSHTNPDGNGPNILLKRAGYRLPSWWGTARNANYIESISGGRSSARATYDGWMNSPGHKKHVLAESDFYAGQTVVAIGHYYDGRSTYRHYWVFLSAPPQE